MTEFYQKVKERLICYARINTESNPHSTSVPTTSCQHDLSMKSFKELVLQMYIMIKIHV